MNTDVLEAAHASGVLGTPRQTEDEGAFTAEQKEYIAGFLAAAVVGIPQARDRTVRSGPATAELCKQEQWKLEEDSLEIWDKLLAHADENKFPNEADTFRFRYHGLFYVAPAQNALMLRCRIPAGELTAAQLHGLADMATEFGGGYADITTRSNIQIREIQPRNIINVLTRLESLGLTSRGSGVDNVRNITASPTAGIDSQELIDTRPFAKALHHYILNHRDLFGLPRKFNVAFDGGGAVSVLADTNDIGFVAVRIQKNAQPGTYFRVELAGITGHKQFARDAGIIVTPGQCVAVAAAMIRVFIEHGDRTDRKKARLKYLLDRWGVQKFLEEVQKKLSFPLAQFPAQQCEPRPQPLKHGHIGIYRQPQRGLNYIGVVIPVGRMTPRQMHRLADLAQNYGSGELRLTPWQNLLTPNIPDGFVETVKRSLLRIGFHYEASTISGGLVACTGNTGCKWASTNTKGQAVELGRFLEKHVQLDQPINIHLTGCPNSCAQHYIGDIGLLGVKTTLSGESVEAYNVVLGGGAGCDQSIAKEVFKGIPFSALPELLKRVLTVYKEKRRPGESFASFTRRHEVKQLQELFSD